VDNSDAKWFMIVGSGPTTFAGSSAQASKIFAVDLKTGPVDASTGASLVSSFATGDNNAFMGDLTTLDVQLDYRVDVVYGGNVIPTGSTNPTWIGKLYRLTTGGGAVTPATWGVTSSGARVPTILITTFPTDNSLTVGPITAAPTVAADDMGLIWAFFGTGRFFGTSDKTNADTQYFFGVKDPVATGGCSETSQTSCVKNDLVNVSSVTICSVCASGTNQVTGISGVTAFSGTATSTLQGLVQSKDGWYTTLPTSRERATLPSTLIGGAIFFPTFIPSGDVCSASGEGKLYALFYQTGSAYKSSLVGTEAGTGGNTNVSKSISLGTGLSSQMAVHIGARGAGKAGTAVTAGSTGGSGTGNENSTGGSEGRISLINQSSTGASGKTSANAALTSWSRIVSWINQRD
jgi:type IV pilus assembly protein PilY1